MKHHSQKAICVYCGASSGTNGVYAGGYRPQTLTVNGPLTAGNMVNFTVTNWHKNNAGNVDSFFIIAMSGSFDVHLDDGFGKKSYHLNRSYYGLYVPPMIWREIDNFSSGSVCLVLASTPYEESDYYRDYEAFVKAAKALRGET